MFITRKFALTLRIACLILLILPLAGRTQVVTEATKKKVGISAGLFTDIWTKMPAGMDTRAINQGVHVYAMYNAPFGKSNFSFAIGAGISIHNIYWNYLFRGSTDSLQFIPINDTLDYKRSKLTMPYLELPVEFRLKTKSKIMAAVGFKIGYMVNAHSKWVGDDYIYGTANNLKVSFKDIKYIERFAYGPTARFGYKWFHVYGYYQLSGLFNKSKGPSMAPVTVGFLLMPF